MKFLKDIDKKYIIIFGVILLLIIVLFQVTNNDNDNKISKFKDYEVRYEDGKIIKYKKFTKKLNDSKTITIENKSNTVKVMSIKWVNVESTLKEQNEFLYEIKCEGSGCKNISPSQVPSFDCSVITDIYLEVGTQQEYTVMFTYNGSKEDAKFSGKLIIEEEITDNDAYQKYMKERNEKEKAYEKFVDDVINQK